MKTEKIGQQLLESHLISQEQLDKATKYSASMGVSLADAIVKLGFISDNKLTNLLSQKHDLPVCDLKNLVLPENLMKRVPWELIQKHQMVPIGLNNKTLVIAIADPMDFDAAEELQFATGLQVEFNLAPRKQIEQALSEFASRTGQQLGGAPGSAGRLRPASQATLKALRESGEKALVDDLQARSDGALNSSNLTRADMREALIPLLIKKGVISKQELYDGVMHVLLEKGVISQREIQQMK